MKLHDEVTRTFFARQLSEGLALAADSDVVELAPLAANGEPPLEYLARFRATGLVRAPDGEIVNAERFDVQIAFHPSHLRRPDCVLIRVVDPAAVFHPNVVSAIGTPFGPLNIGQGMVCIGPVKPCTGLIEILYRIHALLTYNNWGAHDGVNPMACEWARRPEQQSRFPLDRRPLRRPKSPPAAELARSLP